MQMLAAGGMVLLTDDQRKADTDNPRGYCEWEPVKQLPKQPNLIDQAEGKAVKVITQLLMAIPPGRAYKVIFMERPLAEVLASQDEMLRRRGKSDQVSHEVMASVYQEHLGELSAWLKTRRDVVVHRQPYRKVLQDPLATANSIKDFLGIDLNVEAMTGEVDPNLYRNRRP
jgi:hypothetical protein